MNSQEMGLSSGNEVLRVTYRGEVVYIPVASNFLELKTAVVRGVIPGFLELNSQKKQGQLVDIGLVSYQYETDKMEVSSPNAAKALIEFLKNAGFSIPNQFKKYDPIAPERLNFISEMRKRGDYYFSLDHFNNATYIIGPIIVDEIERIPGLYDYVAEVEASWLNTNSSVAVHGATLLHDIALPEGRDRIFDREIVGIIERIFYPFDLRSIKPLDDTKLS